MKVVWMTGVVALLAIAACGSDDGGVAKGADAHADAAPGADAQPGFGDAAPDALDAGTGGEDASPDAGAQDAGTDSGSTDGSADSGSADAGSADSDAGAEDTPPPVLCTPGATRCAPGEAAVEQCLANGTGWQLQQACPDACVEAACVEVVCAPSKQLCDGDILRVCNAQGTASTDVETCANGCLPTVNGAACQQCEAGAKGCTDTGDAWECVHPTEPPTETACAPGLEACIAGGCAGLLAWTLGDTEADAMLWLAIHTAACALDGALAGDDHLCWAVDTTKLQAAVTAEGFAAWLCGGVQAGTLSAADFLPVGAHDEAAIFQAAQAAAGCAGPAQLALPEGILEPGHPVGELCELYVHAAGTVSIAPCP